MGYEHRVYFGPYIRAENPEVVQNVTFPSCGNDDCPRSMRRVEHDVSFCHRCGAPTAMRATTRKARTVNPYDAVEAHLNDVMLFNDEGGDPDKDILIPNRTEVVGRSCFYDNESGDGQFEVTSALIEHELGWFGLNFAAAIKAIHDAYGSENVTLAWGVLSA
jgi:hypothetical protein